MNSLQETLYINKSTTVVWINNRANNKINVESFNFNNIPFIFNDQITFHDTRNTNASYISLLLPEIQIEIFTQIITEEKWLGRYNWITSPYLTKT